jgi:4-hydroxy-2-oxoglutarate aldolase
MPERPETRNGTRSLGGIFPPIPTPFDERGEVAYGALTRNIERWNTFDLSGYVVLGSNGEAVYLDEDEKARVLSCARAAVPAGKLMIAGTGRESVRGTIVATQQAAEIGADAALVITPHFYPARREHLVGYYAAVADASPIPVILYNVPKFTHLDMDAGTIAEIAEHENVIGIKDSGGNITKIADVVRMTGPGFQVLAGSAGFLFPSLAVGAVGGVVALANVAPAQAVRIAMLYGRGNWDEASALQREMVPVNAAVTARYGVAGLKAAMDMLGWYGGPVRAPLLDLAADARADLRQILVEGRVL